MKVQTKKVIALGLVGAMSTALLSGCGGKKSSADNEFTWLIDKAPNTAFYGEYEENPSYKYWASMEWDAEGNGEGKTISVDFITPPAGSEQDNINTLIATGEYPDVMSLSYSAQKATELYEEGIALDLTEYVDKYMPNYKAWIEAHPEYAYLMTNHVDGEDRYIQLFNVSDQAPEMWGGFVYRRDWIAKYGKDASGNAFEGGYDAKGIWTDNIVFPSGETDPMYISDWEWMLDIFSTALKEQGIRDGYPMTLPYSGFYQTQDIVSGFGDGAMWYMDENGKACFGGDSEGFRTYIECVSKWYKNGWIDPAFDEKTNDTFFTIDTANTYAGKVGAWYGMSSQLDNLMDTSNGDKTDPLNGICLFGAPQPINDVYGSADVQGKEPFVFFGNSLITGGVIITNKAEEKDIATLCTAIDYLYSQEGGLLKSFGLSDKQQAELQDEFYNAHGLSKGTYDITTDADGNTIYNVHNERDAEDDLAQAAMFGRVVGLDVQKNVERGYTSTKQHSVDLWVIYSDYGMIDGAISGQLGADDAAESSQIQSNIMTYQSQEIAKFVNGTTNVKKDSDWKAYCDGLNKYNPQKYCDLLNKALGK